MQRQVNRSLLKQAFIQVYYIHSKKNPEERRERPIPGWKHEFLNEAADCIMLLRIELGRERKAGELQKQSGEPVQIREYNTVKSDLLSKLADERRWTQAKRNLFSSVLATYRNFDTNMSRNSADRLRELEIFFNMFNFPGEETL